MAKTGSIITGARLLVTIAFIVLPVWANPAAQASETDSNNGVADGAVLPKLKVYAAIKAPNKEAVEATKAQIGNESVIGSGPKLPLWLYGVESPRDGNFYTGVMVGRDPFNGGGTADIATYIVPVVIKTNSVVTAISKTGIFTTKPGVTVFDPTKADACLGTSNNVALTLLQESPIVKSANFNFGGTPVGETQYTDAFQRSNFWKPLGGDDSGYHVLLNPVTTLPVVIIDVPAAHGAAVPGSLYGLCSTLGVVDLNWLDAYLDSTVLPALVSKGVNPGNFPYFEYKNVVQSVGTPGFDDCCVLGYHSYSGYPIQTYAVVDFDTSRFFSSTAVQDTGIAAHEVAEWMNDPFGDNYTPAWGNTGQVVACQGNLEVGDPLTGTNAPPIVMPNGFTYHLQELAFFSWFFGGPSTGIHGWYSDNATFLTDAGPVCQTPPPTSSSGWKFIQLTN